MDFCMGKIPTAQQLKELHPLTNLFHQPNKLLKNPTLATTQKPTTMESSQTARKLKMLGMVLFLLGLITGFVVMKFVNPRQGLAAHLEGVMNGTFLVVAGFVWSELWLSPKAQKAAYGLLLYGTFANWFFTNLGAVWGTSRITPLAGAGFTGSTMQENIVAAGLATVGLSMVLSLLLIIYGLRGKVNR